MPGIENIFLKIGTCSGLDGGFKSVL